jgi:patatin-like phospholipase/acyl hydrolase
VAARRENRKQDAGQDEEGREHRRHAGQQVGSAARRHKARRSAAAADAEAAAFRALDENHPDERERDQRMDHENERAHRKTNLTSAGKMIGGI